ncbi:PREDICTED: putative disease resistance protein RGA3 [Nelumbo nucifera]|uniref:Disease resistance protein RGA3 n=2 Tax=Nelumbo nucifera TaxID=4432 RepID=A0A1U8BAV3_NELNU|nr:PREDICTED: putative disease resistance protein RGA3 [Nelumbo nucifera]DAD46339.1 TPA_asm: hypothetical protein HUJ06_004569 [Nelumbo nucifera]
MAEAVIGGVTEGIINKLISLIADEIGLAWGFKGELRKLQNTLVGIQNVLEDAETLQVTDMNVKKWLMSLKDVSYEADDVLDEFATEMLRYKVENTGNRLTKKVRNFLTPSSNNPVAFRLRMVHKIRNINVKLDEIAKERDRFHFKNVTTKERITNNRETTASLDDDDLPVVGRDKDKWIIIDKLIKSSASPEATVSVSVLPIVGMGGLGKTTLAKLVYNDASIQGFFDLKMWVCVSDDFDVKRLATEIIHSAGNTTFASTTNLNTIETSLRSILEDKRFLIVLDDVWNENVAEWNRFRKCLGDGAKKGSKILVTTRSEKVASIVHTHTGDGPTPLIMHHLKGLSFEDCWSIFKQRAFGYCRVDVAEDQIDDLVEIGKALVKRCQGVPLAAKALGGLMRNKRSKEEWVWVRDSGIWKQFENDTKILPALKLSYDDLPYYLKQCFAYCSVFPKDHKIIKYDLIRQWIAHGFVVAAAENDEANSLVDTADGYFNSLLGRSFFQDVERYSSGNIWRCKMHDLMHDLAQSVNGDECNVIELSSAVDDDRQQQQQHNNNKLVRWIHEKSTTLHLSIVSSTTKTITNPVHQLFSAYVNNSSRSRFHIHTIILLSSNCWSRINVDKRVLDFICLNFKCLRLLDLQHAKIREVSSRIGKLKHLRYLDLSDTNIEELPDSITNLYNLQTLFLFACCKLKQLPRDMRKMISLRDLDIRDSGINKMPEGMGQLTNLQTLRGFVVGKDGGGGIGDLGPLNHLRELDIVFKAGCFHNLNLDRRAREEISRAKLLKEKRNLGQLSLSWREDEEDNSVHLDHQEVVNDVLLEALQPNSNLKWLLIEGFPGTRLPSWITMAQHVYIFVCPQLRSLKEGNPNSVLIEELYIRSCRNLTSLWKGIQGFTSLKQRRI